MATLNINGPATKTRIEMLHDFLRRNEIDILFLQEGAHPTLIELRNYKTNTNVGTAMQGTALVTMEEITITISQSYHKDVAYWPNFEAYG